LQTLPARWKGFIVCEDDVTLRSSYLEAGLPAILNVRDDSPEGVALLKREADGTNDTAVKHRLLWAASKALARCAPSEKKKCQAAAKTGYPD
jgi:hypothetical protein